MENTNPLLLKLRAILAEHSKYKLDAYQFVMAGLNYTVSRLPASRHVTGQELSESLRDYSVELFGPLARNVLEYWGIRQTGDFGAIVYLLIDAGLMSKNETDTVLDFENVYSFSEAFSKPFVWDLNIDFNWDQETKKEKSGGCG